MDRVTFGLRCFLLVTLGIKCVACSSKLDIKFIKYKSNGHDMGGCCDEFCRACDPKFKVCFKYLDWSNSIEDCHQTTHYEDRNEIDFDSSMGGVTNPFIKHLYVAAVKRVSVRVTVVDDDVFADDLMANLYIVVDNIKAAPNASKTEYRYVTMRDPKDLSKPEKMSMLFGIRIYCDWDWYGPDCMKYCKAYEGGGHYTCNAQTGDRECEPGYKGSYCTEDIDECKQDVCKYGSNCTNLVPGFQCHCPEGFKGEFCEVIQHKCAINPCHNLGTCYGNATHFKCSCPQGFGGPTCNETVEPCDDLPCLNAGTCINMNDTYNFTCTCGDGWRGQWCEELIPTTPSPVIYGDPTVITLVGVINSGNSYDLEEGLVKLVNILGKVPGDVFVIFTKEVFKPKDWDQHLTLTNVSFAAGQRGSIVNKSVVDSIFTKYPDDTINPYLPLPLYRRSPGHVPAKQHQRQQGDPHLWQKIAIPFLVLIVLIVIIIAFLLLVRRRKEKAKALESGLPVGQTNIAFENVLYHENNRENQQRQTDQLSNADRPLPNGNAGGACGDDVDPYMHPVQYDTPVKQPITNSHGQYENSNVACLDTRHDAGNNDYTDFNDLDGARAKEDNPYSELDEIMEEKARIAAMEDAERDRHSLPETDEEDDIDKIKASFHKEDHSNA